MAYGRLTEERVQGTGPARPLISSENPYVLAGFLALLLTVFFYTTAPKDSITSDPLANVLTSWTLAEHGSFELVEHEQLISPEAYFELTWIVHGQDGPVSLFPPGAALVASPLYVFGPSDLTPAVATDDSGQPLEYGVPRLAPSVLVAAGTTAIAVSLLFLTLIRVGSTWEALLGSLVFATATGSWSVASQALWQHGPAMMWLAVALWSHGSVRRELAWIPAILTRPLVGVLAATKMAYGLLVDRQWKRLLAPGISVMVGAGLFLLYNRLVFGSWSPIAAYREHPVLTLSDVNVVAWAENVVSALVDPLRGLLMISPFLIVLIPGLRAAWRESPGFVRASAVAGVAYLLLHYKTHHFAGGDLFFGYRYPLEGLLAAGPLLFLSYQHWVKGHGFRVALLVIGVIAGVGLQAFGVLNPYFY